MFAVGRQVFGVHDDQKNDAGDAGGDEGFDQLQQLQTPRRDDLTLVKAEISKCEGKKCQVDQQQREVVRTIIKVRARRPPEVRRAPVETVEECDRQHEQVQPQKDVFVRGKF